MAFAVGTRVAHEGNPWWHACFVAVKVLLLATPAILVVVMGTRAKTFLPMVRDWMNTRPPIMIAGGSWTIPTTAVWAGCVPSRWNGRSV